MYSTSRRIRFTFFILAFTLGIIYCLWLFALPKFIEWKIKSLCEMSLNGTFESDDLYWEDGRLVFSNPTIMTASDPDRQKHRFSSRDAVIAYEISFWNREIIFKLRLDSPILEIGDDLPQLLQTLSWLDDAPGFFNIKPHLEIKEGSLRHSSGRQWAFGLNVDFSEKPTGVFEVHVDGPGEHGYVICHLIQEKHQGPAVNLEVHDFSAMDFISSLRLMHPIFDKIAVDAGKLNGITKITWLKNGPPNLNAEMSMTDLACQFSPCNIEAILPRLDLSIEHLPLSLNHLYTEGVKGQLKIAGGASFKLQSSAKPIELEKLEGEFVYKKSHLTVALSGLLSYESKNSELAFNAQAELGPKKLVSAGFHLGLQSEGDPVELHFALNPASETGFAIDLALIKFGREEVDILKSALKSNINALNFVDVDGGDFDAYLSGIINKGAIEKLSIDKMAVKKLELTFPVWQLSTVIPEASISAAIDLSCEDITQTLDAEIAFNDCGVGHPSIKGLCDSACGHFLFKRGRLKRSTLTGKFVGFDGNVDFNGGSIDELVQMHFNGGIQKLAALFPDLILQGVGRKFSNDLFSFDAAIKRHPCGVAIEGRVNITDHQSGKEYPIDAAFNVVRTSEQIWQQWPPHQQASSFWSEIALKTLFAFMPASISPSMLILQEWMQQQLGWNGFIVKDGNFSAMGLPLEKFVEPFLFDLDQFKLSGIGDFQGTFDFDKIIIKYQSNNITIENDDLTFEVGTTGGMIDNPKPLYAGEHFFDLRHKSDFGQLSWNKGTYFEKNQGLLFTDIDAKAALEGKKIYIDKLSTSCHQMLFNGAIEIDYTSPEPGYFDVDVLVHTMEGKISNLQGIFSHFDHLELLSTLPIEGNVSLKAPGGYMCFAFEPGDFRLQAKTEGLISQAYWTSSLPGMALERLSLAFDYDHAAKTLFFEDVKGTFFANHETPSAAYAIDGSSLHFDDLSCAKGEFDFHLDGSEGELLRLKGSTHALSIDPRAPLKYTFDNSITHIGSAHPLMFEFAMDRDLHVEELHLKLPFQLETMLLQIHPFINRTSTGSMEALLKQPHAGCCCLEVEYKPNTAQIFYTMEGCDLSLGGHLVKSGFLKGKKKGSLWSIEQLKLDDLSIAADLLKHEQKLCFNFLGISWNDCLLAGLEGNYLIDKQAFEGRVNLLELNLNKLANFKKCSPFVEKYAPSGQFKGSGKLRLELINYEPGWRLDTSLDGSIQSFELLGIHFHNVDHLSCHWDSNERLTVKEFFAPFSSCSERKTLGDVNVAITDYDFVREEVSLEQVRLEVPAKHLNAFAELLQKSFPDIVSDFSIGLIRNCKREGELKALVKLKASPDTHDFKVDLPEGKYWFCGLEHELGCLALKHDERNMDVLLQYVYQGYPFWLQCYSVDSKMNHGRMCISSRLSDLQHKDKGLELLNIDWRNHPHAGFIIDNVKGQFCGLRMNLENAYPLTPSQNELALAGHISLNVPVASALLSQQTREGLAAWGVGKGYVLQGLWLIKKQSDGQSTSPFSFNGVLSGNVVEFRGYEFDMLQAQLNWTREKIQLSNLWLQDPAGSLQIERLTMLDTQKNDLWAMSLKNLNLTGFRPTLLKRSGQAIQASNSHFVIPKLDIGELTGILGTAASFRGKGIFHFTNHSKRVLYHPLFVIPSEILNRIGLDMGVLTPVMGSVLFDIHDAKVILTKFKDVYSEGKLSKFYLSSDSESYLDFDGGLHLKVRMKQYNLLFKLAELFTANVYGTLEHPFYSLQKLPHRAKSPRGIKRRRSR